MSANRSTKSASLAVVAANYKSDQQQHYLSRLFMSVHCRSISCSMFVHYTVSQTCSSSSAYHNYVVSNNLLLDVVWCCHHNDKFRTAVLPLPDRTKLCRIQCCQLANTAGKWHSIGRGLLSWLPFQYKFCYWK